MKADNKQRLQDNSYNVVKLTKDYQMRSDRVMAKYMIIVLCTRGFIDYEFNMERVHLEAGMRVCYTHVTHLRVLEYSDDYEVSALVMGYEFSFNCTEGVETNLIQSLFDNPVANIADARIVRMVGLLLDTLEQYKTFQADQQNIQVSMSLVRNILLLIADHSENSSLRKQPYSMADTYFRNFINNVTDNVKREHEVTYYADILNITPKYLSEICKLKTGHKAKEIISAILLRSLKADLIGSGKSMKELAAEYGFADQSSFGKFFRKITGLSPLHYRQHNGSKNNNP